MRRLGILAIAGAVVLVSGLAAYDEASAATKKSRPRTSQAKPGKPAPGSSIPTIPGAEKPDAGPMTMPVSLDAKPEMLAAAADAPISLDRQSGFQAASGPRSLDR